MHSDKEQLKQNNMIRFIEATQELIDTIGLEKVSIRKIAEKAGFHNSTIYLYFQDVDELILLASLKHFNEYSKALSSLSTQNLSPIETFFYIWNFFADTVFDKANIFYNFFFGKHSDDLSPIIKQYYVLFPEEKPQYSKEIEEMYYGSNIQARCKQILTPIMNEQTRVTEENIDIINDIIVSYLKSLLTDKCSNPSESASYYKEKLMNVVTFLVK